MSYYLDAREWIVEELGQAHAVLTCRQVSDEFVLPRGALPPEIQEGDALSVLATADRMAADREMSAGEQMAEEREPSDADATGADAIFAEALRTLEGVKAGV